MQQNKQSLRHSYRPIVGNVTRLVIDISLNNVEYLESRTKVTNESSYIVNSSTLNKAIKKILDKISCHRQLCKNVCALALTDFKLFF